MKIAFKKWNRATACMLGGGMLAMAASAFAACWGDTEVVAEYLFIEGEGSTVVNTGIDEDDGNAALVNGAGFSADAAPSNGDCGWSVQLPGTGSGATTPAAETEDFYDPFAEASRFTILAWVRRESGAAGSNTSARIVSDTSSLTLTNTTAGVEFRFSGSGGGLYLRVNGSEVGTAVPSVPPNGNEWRHVAVVYDGTRPATNVLTRNAHFYVDGIQRGDGNVLQGAVVGTNDNPLTLGNSSVGRGIANLLVGKMDDVIILYDVAPAAVGNGKTSETIRCYMELNDDIERPVILAPDDVSANTDPGQCSSTNVVLGEPTASDNCGVASVANDAPEVFPSGTTLVVWTATDYAGNVDVCTQTVVVVDVENPVFVAPSNVTMDAGICLEAVTNHALADLVATDNCGVTMLYGEIPATLPIGTNPVVWHAYDAASNHAACTQQVVVVPSQTLDCDGDGLTDYEEVVTYSTDPGVADTDGDGHADGREVALGTDPLDGNDFFGIMINAALPITNSMPNPGEWVELLNVGPAAKPLEGFYLQTATPDGWTNVFTFPAGTTLDAGDFLSVGTNGDFQAELGLPDSPSNPPAMFGIRLVAPGPSVFVADALLYGFTNVYGFSLDGFGDELPIVKPKLTNVIRRTWIGYDSDGAGDWMNVPATSWFPHTQGDYLDLDGDGLSNALEIAGGVYPDLGGSRIDLPDSDFDGRNDAAEWADGTDPYRADTDGDAFPWGPFPLQSGSDLDEWANGTDPLDPDMDGDGIPDGWEIAGGLDPFSPDSDSNGTLDGGEDSDGDGIINSMEVAYLSNLFDEDDIDPRPYLWDGGDPGGEIDEKDIGWKANKRYQVNVSSDCQPVMVQVQEYGYMAEDFSVGCDVGYIHLNADDLTPRNRLYCIVPSNQLDFAFWVTDGDTTWANETFSEYGADILLRHAPAGIDLAAGVPEESEESVGFLLADKSAHPGAVRRAMQIVGPTGGWGYATNVKVTYDVAHLLLYDAPEGGNAIPSATVFPVGGGLPDLYAEGVVHSGLREAWVKIEGSLVPVHDRVVATVLKADIGPVGPLADRTLHPEAPREPLVLKQTLPAEWHGQMRLSLSNAVAYEAPTGGEPIDLAQTPYANATLPHTVYLAGVGCGMGEAKFAVVDLADCATNVPLRIFGVNATLDGVVETDEETPGGFIADRTTHTNALRTALALEAFGPAASQGTLDLTWNSSLIQMYSAPDGGMPLQQYSVPFANFTSTTLYVEGFAPGGDVLQWAYSEQTNCVDRILVTVLKVELRELSFTNNQTIKSDDGTTDYTAPHWDDPNGNGNAADGHAYPLCFTRNTKMKLTAGKWHIEPASPPVTINIKGDEPGSLDFPETTAMVSGNDVTVTNLECSNPFANEVDFLDPMSISWQFSFDGGSNWCNAGTSTNRVYVTWTNSLQATLYHTVVHIGSKSADGENDPEQTVTKAWGGFTNLVVQRVSDGHTLTYYKTPYDPACPFDVAGLLSGGDGRCGAWARLFRDVVKAQGIAGAEWKQIVITPQSGLTPHALWVKNQDLTPLSATPPSPPVPLPGVAGQGTADPSASVFVDHAVVTYGTNIYDSSYGTIFTELGDWQKASLDAISYNGGTVFTVNSGAGWPLLVQFGIVEP